MRFRTAIAAATLALAAAAGCSSSDGGPTALVSTGGLTVAVTTAGDDAPATYGVTLDGGSSRAVDANGAVTFTSVEAGARSVELTGVPDNCSVAGGRQRSVTVSGGQTVTASFAVSCLLRTGALVVSTRTSGDDVDADGYEVGFGGARSAEPVAVTASLAPIVFPVGELTVRLDGLADNCAVAGENPRSVTIPFRDTVDVAFTVNCALATGTIRYTTETTGVDPDPDGYLISVDGGPEIALGPNETIDFSGLAPGDHELLLSGVAPNCTLAGPNPAIAGVSVGDTTDVTASVSCVEGVNDPPAVAIASPDPTPNVVPTQVQPGDPVTLEGSATDPEDGDLAGAALSWSSNVDGDLGTGATLVTTALSEGLHTITLTAADSGGETTSATALLLVVPLPDAARYDITLRLSPGVTLTPGQRTAIETAVAMLEAAVIGELADVPLTIGAGSCGAAYPPMNEVVDDLVLFLSIEPIDGPGGILGAAGPCILRGFAGLPVLGGMRFDEADLVNLEANGLIEELLLHEAMHVMGFGSIWSLLGLLQLPSNPARGGTPGNDTYFDGPEALARFDSLGGAVYTGGNVVPVENDTAVYGGGSLDSHWRESVFDQEIMTPSLDFGGAPFSVLTIGQFQDLGYVVDFGAAEAFAPMFALQAGPTAEFHLRDDVLDGPMWIVEPDGALRRIR